MAQRTATVESLDREVAADRLNDIASALRRGDLDVRVGNKEITLHPTDTVNFQLEVVEQHKRFRGRRETVKLELDWKPE